MSNKSTSSLFRNVYQLVSKDNGQPLQQNVDDVDQLIASTRGCNSQFSIQPVRRRVPIAEQYERRYQETQRLSRNLTLKRQDTSSGYAGLSKFLLLETEPASKTVRATDRQRFGLTTAAGTSLTRERISLHDLRNAEVLTKIKNRCQITNPGLFEDPAASMKKTGQSNAFLGLNSMKDFNKQSQQTRPPKQSTNNLQAGTLAKTNFSLVSNPSLEPRSDLNLMAAEDIERSQINNALAAYERRMFDAARFTREDLKEFLWNKYQLNVTELTAIEGVSYCRGKLMEKSPTYSREKLIEWLCIQIPILQTTQQILDQQAETVARTKQTRLAALRLTDRGGASDDHPDVDEVLKLAELNTKSKAKLMNSLMALDQELQEHKSKQGMLGQMAAQQRLVHTAREQQRARKVEVKRQINDTCNFESAVRALNLQKHMNPSWSEVKNSFQVVSKMTSKQQRRLNEMMDKRLEFPK